MTCARCSIELSIYNFKQLGSPKYICKLFTFIILKILNSLVVTCCHIVICMFIINYTTFVALCHCAFELKRILGVLKHSYSIFIFNHYAIFCILAQYINYTYTCIKISYNFFIQYLKVIKCIYQISMSKR